PDPAEEGTRDQGSGIGKVPNPQSPIPDPPPSPLPPSPASVTPLAPAQVPPRPPQQRVLDEDDLRKIVSQGVRDEGKKLFQEHGPEAIGIIKKEIAARAVNPADWAALATSAGKEVVGDAAAKAGS